MITIKVLGSGCANCKRVEQVARKAITDLGIEAEIIKVADYGAMLEYNLLSTPGLVINDTLVSAGRVPSLDDVTKWLNAVTKQAG